MNNKNTQVMTFSSRPNLLAAAVLTCLSTAGQAKAETLAAACIGKVTGEFYNVTPYKSATAKACRSGDEVMRLIMYQPGPDTKIAKRSKTVADGEWAEIATGFHQDLIFAVHSEDAGCRLTIDDVDNAIEYVVADVPVNAWQDGLGGEITVIDYQANEPDGTTGKASKQRTATKVVTKRGTVVFHDLYVDNTGSDSCYVGFLAEYGPGPQTFLEK